MLLYSPDEIGPDQYVMMYSAGITSAPFIAHYAMALENPLEQALNSSLVPLVTYHPRKYT